MKQELFDALKNKYPNTFKKLSYIECDDGWYNLIDNLSYLIESEINRKQNTDPENEMYVVQIKEKFSTLSYYMSNQTDYMSGAIRLAESLSADICEVCGGIGHRVNVRRWMKTLCDQHHQEALDRLK
jgi:predicted acetyltransferase